MSTCGTLYLFNATNMAMTDDLHQIVECKTCFYMTFLADDATCIPISTPNARLTIQFKSRDANALIGKSRV